MGKWKELGCETIVDPIYISLYFFGGIESLKTWCLGNTGQCKRIFTWHLHLLYFVFFSIVFIDTKSIMAELKSQPKRINTNCVLLQSYLTWENEWWWQFQFYELIGSRLRHSYIWNQCKFTVVGKKGTPQNTL